MRSASRSSATSSTASTFPSFLTSRVRKTNPANPAGAEELPLSNDLDFGLRILVALILGLALGLEREYHGHPAGMRTMALIGAGACLFTAVALIPAFGKNVDPTRIAA